MEMEEKKHRNVKYGEVLIRRRCSDIQPGKKQVL